MTTPQIRIINGDTVIDREMTDDEYAVYEIMQADNAATEARQAAREAARASALAKLADLGLTADEIAALVGA